MFISPRIAIEQGWIRFPEYMTREDTIECVQPNAIDFTVDHLWSIVDDGSNVLITKNNKEMCSHVSVPLTETGEWCLSHHQYDILSDFYVNIPTGVAAVLVARSTFTRNGMFITSGLYDSGFSNYIGCVLHKPTTYNVTIEPHVRIGQIIFVESQDSGILYNGTYANKQEAGQSWTETMIRENYNG